MPPLFPHMPGNELTFFSYPVGSAVVTFPDRYAGNESRISMENLDSRSQDLFAHYRAIAAKLKK